MVRRFASFRYAFVTMSSKFFFPFFKGSQPASVQVLGWPNLLRKFLTGFFFFITVEFCYPGQIPWRRKGIAGSVDHMTGIFSNPADAHSVTRLLVLSGKN
jgi:hypothetical protein